VRTSAAAAPVQMPPPIGKHPIQNAQGQQTGKAQSGSKRLTAGGIFHFVGIFVGINQNTMFYFL
jgi:hypothetical protein